MRRHTWGINSCSSLALKGFCCREFFRRFPFHSQLPEFPSLSSCWPVPFSRCAAVDSANVCANIAVFFAEGKPPVVVA